MRPGKGEPFGDGRDYPPSPMGGLGRVRRWLSPLPMMAGLPIALLLLLLVACSSSTSDAETRELLRLSRESISRLETELIGVEVPHPFADVVPGPVLRLSDGSTVLTDKENVRAVLIDDMKTHELVRYGSVPDELSEIVAVDEIPSGLTVYGGQSRSKLVTYDLAGQFRLTFQLQESDDGRREHRTIGRAGSDPHHRYRLRLPGARNR